MITDDIFMPKAYYLPAPRLVRSGRTLPYRHF